MPRSLISSRPATRRERERARARAQGAGDREAEAAPLHLQAAGVTLQGHYLAARQLYLSVAPPLDRSLAMPYRITAGA